eukprot:CAMPEP_0172717858 /NCGR_PEP_ID=MMETSP1074-20121228/72763_1 /TAXON_ID=2916 /ORGANISM="Ceratium fusus, Strain PA161109" /LENGTH=378 /DNA_ID=CAMNT_0013542899 /DNA_START=189 /DNA_END=1328 /DNA_ORIENTATION=+
MTMGFSVMVYVYESFTYNVIFVGHILPAFGRGALTMPFLVLFNTFWCLAFWSHLQAHLADPGTVPKRWEEFVHSFRGAIPIAPSRPEFQPGKATLCKRCQRSRPERAHHCQFCGFCVLRYDHHCPWINNCVGYRNHKFFLLLVFYGCLASFFALATCIPELLSCACMLLGIEDRSSLDAKNLATSTVVAFLTFGAIALFLSILLTLLLITYVPFATQNLTTVEETYTNMTNPFDLGATMANLEQIFGLPGPDWLLPVQPLRPQTDGVFFPRAGERLGSGLLNLLDNRRSNSAENLEEPLAGGSASRSNSRGSTSYNGASLDSAERADQEIEQLWRLRYHAKPQTTSQQVKPLKPQLEGGHLKSRWSTCCTRSTNAQGE